MWYTVFADKAGRAVRVGKAGAKTPIFRKVFHRLVSKDLTERDFFPILRCLSGKYLP
jgi:hypothetical protein